MGLVPLGHSPYMDFWPNLIPVSQKSLSLSHSTFTHTHAHTHTHVYTCTHTYTRVHMHTHIHTCTHAHTHTHVYTCTHTYTRVHMHTHTHVYTCTHTCIQNPSLLVVETAKNSATNETLSLLSKKADHASSISVNNDTTVRRRNKAVVRECGAGGHQMEYMDKVWSIININLSHYYLLHY